MKASLKCVHPVESVFYSINLPLELGSYWLCLIALGGTVIFVENRVEFADFDSWAVVRCANFGRCASSELGSESTEEVCNTANGHLRPSKLEVDPCVAGIREYSPLVIVPSGGPGPFGGCG